MISGKVTNSSTNASYLIQTYREGVELMEILNLEMEVLKELQFEVNKPTILDFQLLFLTLLRPHDKITDEQQSQKFEKIIAKLNIYVSENASFLEYSIAQLAAACLLLTMRYTGLLQHYGTNNLVQRADPTLAWNRETEKLLGLLFNRDI